MCSFPSSSHRHGLALLPGTCSERALLPFFIPILPEAPQGRAKPGSVQQETPLGFRFPCPKTTWTDHPASELPLPSCHTVTQNTSQGNWGKGARPQPQELVQVPAPALALNHAVTRGDPGPVTSPLWASTWSLPNDRMQRSFKL